MNEFCNTCYLVITKYRRGFFPSWPMRKGKSLIQIRLALLSVILEVPVRVLDTGV
ncbi:unnamed protein product [Debaryomyces tyrocola]|nr:unnamed protein product [Debaryomyces tyrocola]